MAPGLLLGVRRFHQSGSEDSHARIIAQNARNFLLFNQHQPSGQIDLDVSVTAFSTTFRLRSEPTTVNYIYPFTSAGRLLAFWENNPWNPGTRYVMSRIPFDRDAVTLTAPEARRMLSAGGFEMLRMDFLFIFPGCSLAATP